MSGDDNQTVEELTRDFYLLNQFGLTSVPETIIRNGSYGDVRGFAAAFCSLCVHVGGKLGEGELMFLSKNFASQGYPQSIIDGVRTMCDAAEGKPLEEIISEIKMFIPDGAVDYSYNIRQITYDCIRAVERDGDCLNEAKVGAIANVATALGVNNEDLDRIHELVARERVLMEEISQLFPSSSSDTE